MHDDVRLPIRQAGDLLVRDLRTVVTATQVGNLESVQGDTMQSTSGLGSGFASQDDS